MSLLVQENHCYGQWRRSSATFPYYSYARKGLLYESGSFTTPFTTCFLLCLITKIFCINYYIRMYPGMSFSKPDCCSCPRRLILGELDRQKSRGKISRNPAGKMRKSSEIDQSAISQPPPQFVTQT